MITISDKQMEAMDALMMEEYVQRLTVFYRERAPEFVRRFSEARLKEKIAEAIPQARERGLNSADAIMQYVGLVLLAGPRFHEDPKVRAFMTMPGYSPELKLKRLLQLLHRKLAAAGQMQSNG
jgi:hypothetical protein